LSVRSDDGDITIENAVGKETEISVNDGRVRIIDSESDFYIDSDDGDISLKRIAGKALDIRTNDGDVDIVFTGSGKVDVSVKTDDGRVEMTFDNPVSAAFIIETDDGYIRLDSDDVNVFRENEHLVKGEFGDGEGKIRVRTNDGAVSLIGNF